MTRIQDMLKGRIDPDMYNLILNLDLVQCYPELDSNELNRVKILVALTLSWYKQEGRWPIQPTAEFEITQYYDNLRPLLDKLVVNEISISEIVEFLRADKLHSLALQGMRMTEGSTAKFPTFPELDMLISSAVEPYNEFLTQLARARAKHSLRCEIQYWGEISGSPDEQNKEAEHYLYQLLTSFTWWNYFRHFKNEVLFEIRDLSGHGMRWSIEVDNEENIKGDENQVIFTFVGLVEPIDPNLGTKFEYQGS